MHNVKKHGKSQEVCHTGMSQETEGERGRKRERERDFKKIEYESIQQENTNWNGPNLAGGLRSLHRSFTKTAKKPQQPMIARLGVPSFHM